MLNVAPNIFVWWPLFLRENSARYIVFFFLRNGSDIYPFLNISYRCSSFLYYYIYSKLINLYSLHVYLLISRSLNFLSFSKIWHNINYYCIWRIEIKKFRERKIKKFHEERVSKFINNRSSRKSVPMTRVDETISSRTRTRISRTWFSPIPPLLPRWKQIKRKSIDLVKSVLTVNCNVIAYTDRMLNWYLYVCDRIRTAYKYPGRK